MRPIASTMTEIDNLEGDIVEGKISEKHAPFVMRSMADLYSDRELACIREYSTNAYDSNVEKALRDGHKVAPIHVTLPNAMNPYFTVQDFGVGMSEETMRETYLTFGESSKRESDDFNGMLGFGSKSAVAYTNTFTVTAVQNGIKTVGVVTRREDAMGGYHLSMKLVITKMPTSEPDGVTVQIPVHNWREFEHKANNFYKFWLPGRVLVNSREPKSDIGDKIADGLFYRANGGDSYVVMGNVPYVIKNSDALFPTGMNRIAFVAYVDPCKCDYVKPDETGDNTHAQVEFVPAREALKYSDHTKYHLHKIINDFVAKSVQMAKDEITNAPSHSEAFKVWTKWRKVLGNRQVEFLTYKGDKLVETFKIEGHRYDVHSYRYGTWAIREWPLSSMAQTIIVTDFTINLAAAHKKKVKDWAKFKGINLDYIIFTHAKTIDNVWIDQDRIMDWETIKAEAPKAPKKPRAVNTAPGRKAGTFDIVSKTGTLCEQDVPDTKELWYIMVSDYNRAEEGRGLRILLTEFDKDVSIVKVPANRKDKFLRCYPHAKDIMAWFRSVVKTEGDSLLSEEAKTWLKMEHIDRSKISHLDPKQVADPALARLAEICNMGETVLLKEYNRQQYLANILDIPFSRHSWTNKWENKWKPLDDYPLARQINNVGDKSSHIYLYIESVYKARKDGKNV